MKLREMLYGVSRVEICGTLPESLLNACAKQALNLWDLETVDAFTLRASLAHKQLNLLRELAVKCQCQVTVLRRSGGSDSLRMLRRRMWLLFGAVLTAALLLASSLFIWEIQVQGYQKLSEGRILRALADCGVERGSFWPSLEPDQIRSRMLLELPELAWMTVRVSGCRATVLVSERVEKPELYQEDRAAEILAKKTGIIVSLAVRNGRALVSPGDSVLAGERLVTGRMDSLSHPPRYVRADADVLADTWYEWTAVCPHAQIYKRGPGSLHHRYALKLGKTRINLYGNGKKTLDGYDKIVHEYPLGIRGLFALPLSLIEERLQRYEPGETTEDFAEEIGPRLERRLLESIDGQLLSSKLSLVQGNDRIYVTLRGQCRENIALLRELEEEQAAS